MECKKCGKNQQNEKLENNHCSKRKKTNFHLLTFSTFLHFFSLFCSVYRDIFRQPNAYKEPNYWLTFSG